jgi:hypothetical protein
MRASWSSRTAGYSRGTHGVPVEDGPHARELVVEDRARFARQLGRPPVEVQHEVDDLQRVSTP